MSTLSQSAVHAGTLFTHHPFLTLPPEVTVRLLLSSFQCVDGVSTHRPAYDRIYVLEKGSQSVLITLTVAMSTPLTPRLSNPLKELPITTVSTLTFRPKTLYEYQ